MTVAAGAFAPGHLGELTRLIPFEMVDDALARTGRLQHRIRLLPARVVVYLLLAGCLFTELGYAQVWQRLTAGLQAVAPIIPTPSALRQARQRLGPAPIRALFDLLRGPAATSATGHVFWQGLLLTAIDGTLLSVADSPANLAIYHRQRLRHGGSGYPQIRLSAIVACGTRSVIDAVFDPATIGEIAQAHGLIPALRAGILLLADRNYAAATLITAIAETGAHLLIRCKTNRRLPILARYRDGSYLSTLGATRVRVIEAQIHLTTTAGGEISHRSRGFRLDCGVARRHHLTSINDGDLASEYEKRATAEIEARDVREAITEWRSDGGRVVQGQISRVLLGDDGREVGGLLGCGAQHRRCGAGGRGWPVTQRLEGCVVVPRA